MSETKKYRTWTAQQKIEIVLAGLRGDRSIKEVCRDHEIAETLYYSWRDKLLEGRHAGPGGHGGADRGEGAAPADPRARAGVGS